MFSETMLAYENLCTRDSTREKKKEQTKSKKEKQHESYQTQNLPRFSLQVLCKTTGELCLAPSTRLSERFSKAHDFYLVISYGSADSTRVNLFMFYFPKHFLLNR